jgi:V/A-type H+-transporting ATPase subunit K
MDFGLALALVGIASSVFLPGIGSSIGIYAASKCATGVLSEKPERYGQLFIMVVLPGTQGFYGLLAALIMMTKLNFFTGNIPDVSLVLGAKILAASLPVTYAGLVTAIYQGKVSASGIIMAGKRPEMAFKAGVVYAVMVEIYAILGLLSTLFMLWFGIAWPAVAATV